MIKQERLDEKLGAYKSLPCQERANQAIGEVTTVYSGNADEKRKVFEYLSNLVQAAHDSGIDKGMKLAEPKKKKPYVEMGAAAA